MFGKHLISCVHEFFEADPNFVLDKRIYKIQLIKVTEHRDIIFPYVAISFTLVELPSEEQSFKNVVELTSHILKGLSQGERLSSRVLAREPRKKSVNPATQQVSISITGKVNASTVFYFRFDKKVDATRYQESLNQLLDEFVVTTRKWDEEEQALFQAHSLTRRKTTPFSGNRFAQNKITLDKNSKKRIQKTLENIIIKKATYYKNQGLKFKRRSQKAMAYTWVFAITSLLNCIISVLFSYGFGLLSTIIKVNYAVWITAFASVLFSVFFSSSLTAALKLRKIADRFKKIYITITRTVMVMPKRIVYRTNSVAAVIEEVAMVLSAVNKAEQTYYGKSDNKN